MSGRRSTQAAPSPEDGDGVRISRESGGARRASRLWVVSIALVVLGVAVVAWSLRPPRPDAGDRAVASADSGLRPETAIARAPPAQPLPRSRLQAVADDTTAPVDDPDDLAAWIEPGDREPTGAEVIAALHDAGIRSGIGAFNPPGTSPPLQGLAVPDGFELPEGYVRHHQVTDAGVALEPILMFSPDYVLRDAQGRPIDLPADRVVPPQYAPPGMPLRQARVPAP